MLSTEAASTLEPKPPVVVVAGPTASGKSALALELAAALGGTIINADSHQISRDLPILTAQPDAAAMRRAPHRLYGILDASERGSAARWRALAPAEIAAAHPDAAAMRRAPHRLCGILDASELGSAARGRALAPAEIAAAHAAGSLPI